MIVDVVVIIIIIVGIAVIITAVVEVYFVVDPTFVFAAALLLTMFIPATLMSLVVVITAVRISSTGYCYCLSTVSSSSHSY